MLRFSFFVLLVLGALTLTWAAVDSAQANDNLLFKEDGATLTVPETRENGRILRTRQAVLNESVLSGPGLESVGITPVLNLFPDVHLNLAGLDYTDRGTDSFLLTGKPEGQPQGLVVLTMQGGHLAGTVFCSSGFFSIHSGGKGRCRISQINPAFGTKAAQAFVPASDLAQMAPRPVADEPGEGDDSPKTIDIMLLYTPSAAAASVDIASELVLAVDTTNAVYEASGMTTRLRLVHWEEVAFSVAPGSDFMAEIEQLQSPDDGVIDHIHGLRDACGADVVSLFVWNKDMVNWGLGYTLTNEWLPFDPHGFAGYAFSICAIPSASSPLVMAHEIGHHQGLFHDRYAWYLYHGADYPHGPYFSYGWGYSLLDSCSFTVMAYEDQCRDSGCKRVTQVPYFSNPGLEYEGAPLGIAEGDPEEAFAAKAIDMSAGFVSEFRPTVVPPTAE